MKRILALLLLMPIVAHAGLIQIDAVNDGPIEPGRFSDFTIIFDDLSGDSLLQFDEILFFSGIEDITGPTGSWLTLIGVPDIAGISTASGYSRPDFPNGLWWFEDPGNDPAGWQPLRWTYTASAAEVPEPSTLALFGLGLLGLGFARRRA